MFVADMHCDTISRILYSQKAEEKKRQNLRKNTFHIDLEKMRQGDYLIQNFAMYINLQKAKNPFEECMNMIDVFYREMEANSDQIAPAKSYQDIVKNHADGKISGLLTIEEGGVCQGNLAFLRDFYRLGVRMMTLTWNFDNEIGSPNIYWTETGEEILYGQPNLKRGLTPFGIELIQEMERLGMIVDVSHLSDAGFYDVAIYAKKPFVASHSNARAVCRHTRNLTDDMIRKLAECGGAMGINFEPKFLNVSMPDEKIHATIQQVVEQIKYIAFIAGTGCIGLGSDFDGIADHDELLNASFLPRLEDALWKAGFGQEEIEGIFYKNIMRIYKEILK